MPYTLHEALANLLGDLQVLLLHGSVAQVASLELICLVRRELFNRQGQLSVVLERLDEVRSKSLGYQRRQPAFPRIEGPSRDAVAVRHEFPIARAREGEVRVLVQESENSSRNGDSFSLAL